MIQLENRVKVHVPRDTLATIKYSHDMFYIAVNIGRILCDGLRRFLQITGKGIIRHELARNTIHTNNVSLALCNNHNFTKTKTTLLEGFKALKDYWGWHFSKEEKGPKASWHLGMNSYGHLWSSDWVYQWAFSKNVLHFRVHCFVSIILV